MKEPYFANISEDLNGDFKNLHNNMMEQQRFSEKEILLIEKAYLRASELHSGTKRQSGEAYITHPVVVANFLLKYGFDCDTICAALLHDTVEDTCYTLEDVKNDFNDDIAMLVDGVTKMHGANFLNRQEASVATHQKILKSITKDARIIAIKLVDRLHNMMTLDYLDGKRKLRIATETSDFYVPIARNLGMYEIKDILQDLSIYYLNHDAFLKYYDERLKIFEKHKNEADNIGGETSSILSTYGIPLKYNYKVKNVGGIYSDVSNGRELDQIRDLVAVRMLLNETMQCYNALGAVHSFCKPIEGELLDYIASPKYNGYRSLNTNVLTQRKTQFQVRIRTLAMQQKNSLGVVYNWSDASQLLVNKMCMDLLKLNQQDLSPKDYLSASQPFLKRRITLKTKDGIIETDAISGYDLAKRMGVEINKQTVLIVNDFVMPFSTILTNDDFVCFAEDTKHLIKRKKKRG